MTSDIDVLVVTQYFPPEGRGGNRWLKFLEQTSGSVEGRVVCPPPTTPFGEFDRTYKPWQTERRGGVPVTRLWTYQPVRDTAAGRMLNYGLFSIVASLYVLVNFWRFDCVVTMSSPHTTFLPGAIAKLLGRAWVVDIFDLWIDNAVDLGYVEEGSLSHRAVAKLEEFALTKGDQIIVITPTMGEYYCEKYDIDSEKVTSVAFGVDDDLFEPPDEENLDGEGIAYVGNLGTHVAFQPYIEAVSELDEPVEFTIVGSGERRDELEAMVREYDVAQDVRFLGQQPRETIPDVFASAALSVAPLRTDKRLDYARPYKLIESMATGTPFITSEVTETERLVRTSNAGVTVANDTAEIENAMANLLEDERRRRAMSRNALEFVDEKHRWDSLGTTVQRILQRAVEG